MRSSSSRSRRSSANGGRAQSRSSRSRPARSWAPTRTAASSEKPAGLIDEIGVYRSGGVGVMSGEEVIHIKPPPGRVPILMERLLHWLASTEVHPLIASSVFHYAFELIHPFADGNGRMGRLWQSLILTHWNPLFADLPVESLVHAHQSEYYDALRKSTEQTASAPSVIKLSAAARAAPASRLARLAAKVASGRRVVSSKSGSAQTAR
jgi:Fic family protein